MNEPTNLEKLERIKAELKLRKKSYEVLEELQDASGNRILGSKNDIEHQKIKKEIKESEHDK